MSRYRQTLRLYYDYSVLWSESVFNDKVPALSWFIYTLSTVRGAATSRSQMHRGQRTTHVKRHAVDEAISHLVSQCDGSHKSGLLGQRGRKGGTKRGHLKAPQGYRGRPGSLCTRVVHPLCSLCPRKGPLTTSVSCHTGGKMDSYMACQTTCVVLKLLCTQ
jgi:hypothetical protein